MPTAVTKHPSTMLTRLADILASRSGCQCIHVGSIIELQRDCQLQARLWLYHNASGYTAIFEPHDPRLRILAGNLVAAFNRAMREHRWGAVDE